MGVRVFSFLALFLFSVPASAWGPVASQYVCEQAASSVWGEEAVRDCIPLSDLQVTVRVCDKAEEVLGVNASKACRQSIGDGVFPHPALLSSDVFEDDSNHFDYLKCPIREGGERDWICGDPKDRLAYETASMWLTMAEYAPDLCTRIAYFCVASSYYADTESSLHQVKFVSNDCRQNIEASIDRCLAGGERDCSATQVCRFHNGERGSSLLSHKQPMGESTTSLERAINWLQSEGRRLREAPYAPVAKATLLANSMDLALADDLIQTLEEAGVLVSVTGVGRFETLKYADYVIVLGGQNAPEGVGEVSAQLLTNDQKDELMSEGSKHLYEFGDIWKKDQKVFVCAGHSANDTQRACEKALPKMLRAMGA